MFQKIEIADLNQAHACALRGRYMPRCTGESAKLAARDAQATWLLLRELRDRLGTNWTAELDYVRSAAHAACERAENALADWYAEHLTDQYRTGRDIR